MLGPRAFPTSTDPRGAWYTNIVHFSFFGDQQGPFALSIRSIVAYTDSTASINTENYRDADTATENETSFTRPYSDDPYSQQGKEFRSLEQKDPEKDEDGGTPQSGYLASLFEACTRCIRIR